MRGKRSVVPALLVLAGTCVPAAGSVFFTFDDPATEHEVAYELVDPGGSPHGVLTYGAGMAAPIIDFVVDATEEGGSITEFSANLIWTGWQVGEVTVSGPVSSAMVSGQFDFVEVGSGDSIVSGTFTMGLVIQSMSTGSVITSTSGGLSYVVGPALSAVEPQILTLQPPQDGVYTLTDVTFDDQQIVTIGDQDFFGDFTANAAFTGTAAAEIPSPGSITLAAIGIAVALRRRW